MTELELAASDVWATGISPDSYPTQFLRADLEAMGVIPADRLLSVPDGTRVLVAGAVTHRQRPATAQGVTFINLEDETGMVNILCSPGVWARHRRLAQTASALVIRGQVQNATGAVTVVADRMDKLDVRVASRSRDFRSGRRRWLVDDGRQPPDKVRAMTDTPMAGFPPPRDSVVTLEQLAGATL